MSIIISLPEEPSHLGITKLEMRGRESHTSPSGAMSIRKFYIEPFEKWVLLAEAAEGWVATKERHLPASDVYFVDEESGYNAFMFASEIRVTPVDRDYVSISNTPAINIDLNNPKDISELKMYLQKYNIRELNEGGAFVEIVYRPEISLYNKQRQASLADKNDTTRLFDYLSPEFKSRIVYLPNPDGLLIQTKYSNAFVTNAMINIPPETANPITLHVVDFTVRRSLVADVPWDTIQKCVGKVNKSEWILTDTDLKFPAKTAKFAGPISIKRGLSCFHEKKTWWEIIYLFQCIRQDADEIMKDDGSLIIEKGPITWNHGFFSPKWMPLGTTVLGSAEDMGKTMWYPIYKRDYVGFGVNSPPKAVKGELLYDSTDDFNDLFDITKT